VQTPSEDEEEEEEDEEEEEEPERDDAAEEQIYSVQVNKCEQGPQLKFSSEGPSMANTSRRPIADSEAPRRSNESALSAGELRLVHDMNTRDGARFDLDYSGTWTRSSREKKKGESSERDDNEALDLSAVSPGRLEMLIQKRKK
jgi:hypothetical protein